MNWCHAAYSWHCSASGDPPRGGCHSSAQNLQHWSQQTSQVPMYNHMQIVHLVKQQNQLNADFRVALEFLLLLLLLRHRSWIWSAPERHPCAKLAPVRALLHWLLFCILYSWNCCVTICRFCANCLVRRVTAANLLNAGQQVQLADQHQLAQSIVASQSMECGLIVVVNMTKVEDRLRAVQQTALLIPPIVPLITDGGNHAAQMKEI